MLTQVQKPSFEVPLSVDKIVELINLKHVDKNLNIRLARDEEIWKHGIDFTKKKHLIPVVTQDNIQAVIKLYNQETSYKGDNYEAEIYGYIKAMEYSIPTPQLLAYGILEDGTEYVLLGSIGGEVLHQAPSFLNRAVELLKQLHSEAGILHGDPDSVNFIVGYDNKVYMCDFASCKPNPSHRINEDEINMLKFFTGTREYEI